MRWLRSCVLLLCLIGAASAHALTPADALALAAGDSDVRIDTLNRLAAEPDDKAQALMKALADGAVKVLGEQVLIVADDGSTTDAITGAAVAATLPVDDVDRRAWHLSESLWAPDAGVAEMLDGAASRAVMR